MADLLARGWIDSDNLRSFCERLALETGYGFDIDDWQAVTTGLKRSRHFDYPFQGHTPVHAFFQVEDGASEVTTIRVEGDGPQCLREKLELIMDILATYSVTRDWPG